MSRNKPNGVPPLNTNVRRPTTEGGGSAIVELGDMGDYIEQLKLVSLGTQKLVDLLVGQLQGLSGTIPVLHGFEIVKELRGRSKERHNDIQVAFGQLRAHIEREKSLFYTKNAESIKKIIRERVEQGVKRKLPIVLKERLGRYKECLKSNSVLTGEVEQVMTTMSTRDANSILSPSHPGEKVTLILPHPNWDGITLGNLKNIGGPAIARLARDQGLMPSEDSPDSEPTRTHNLNMVLKHLGVQYQVISSWNGTLFTSPTRETNH